MKKLLIPAIILLLSQISFAQVRIDSVRVKTTLKTIPPVKATVIRKDVASLKIQLRSLADSVIVTKREIDLLAGQMKSGTDSMSEMGEMESLRLQRSMDRLSKLMSTLSNLLKKASETAQGITQNIK